MQATCQCELGLMKITHVITGLSDGGAEGVLYRLCVQDTGNSHCVISLTDGGKYGDLLKAHGVEVILLNSTGILSISKNLFFLRNLLKGLQPDVVHTWMYHADLVGGIAARFAGIKTVLWSIRQSNLKLGHSRFTTIVLTRLLGFLSHFVPQKIACCAVQALEVHAGVGYDFSKLVVLHNGIDVERFSPNPKRRLQVRRSLGVAQDMFLIGMVARFDNQKDHLGLLKALKMAKTQGFDFRCVLAGKSMDKENTALTKWIHQYELYNNIILVGQEHDIASLMNALDLHILSSAFGEGFPNVIGEAMASGVPCLSTDVGDAALIIGDAGWVIPPSKPATMAATLSMIFENQHSTLKAMPQVARDRIKSMFSLEKMIKSYNHIYQELAEK